jgi:hypothetical protein
VTAAEKLKSVTGKVPMTIEAYHAHEAIGSTSIKEILRSPAHYLYAKSNRKDSPAFNLGRAAHMALLEPQVFAEEVVVMPEFWGVTKDGKRTNSPNSTDVKEQRERWILANHGKTIVSAEERADILLMAKAISNSKTARALLTSGAAEESYFCECPDTGIMLKARPDFLRDGMIVDLKTTINAHPAAFVKSIANFQYHISAAVYLDVVSAATGQDFKEFIFIAVEKEGPYGVSVHRLDEIAIEEGRKLYKKALKILAECQKSGDFPSYADEILNAYLPSWAFKAEYEE